MSSSEMPSPGAEHVRKAWERMQSGSPIYNFLLADVDIFSVEPGVVRAKLQVQPNHINSKGTLHGSFSACVMDWGGGLAIASHGLEQTGVSVDIHVSYASTASLGDWLEIEARTGKLGRTLAFTTITISKGVETDSPTLVAQGSHTKYVKR
jgi:acyl-coenzyme A thioesterase 13